MVKTVLVVPLFNTSMKRFVVATETYGKQMIFVCAIAQQECPIRFTNKKLHGNKRNESWIIDTFYLILDNNY